MERARQQREAVQPKNTDETALSAAQRQEIADIEARRAPLQTAQTDVADAERTEAGKTQS